MNVKEEKVVVATWLYYYWMDYNLRWDPTQFGGLEEIIVNTKDIWIPDFYKTWYELMKILK